MTITVDRIRQQYAANAATLRDMLAKAQAVAPRKYRGYTVEHLERLVANISQLSTASDTDLRTHLAGTIFAPNG